MSDIQILFDGTIYSQRNFGPKLNDQLMRVYDHFASAAVIDLTSFGHAVREFLETSRNDYTAHDDYFEWFAPIWIKFMNEKHFPAAESVWRFALQPVQEWEEASQQHVHKGTPYYFWAGTVLLGGDIDRAFILMHRALHEDVVKTGSRMPDTPGSAFVTLDYEKQDQFFRPLVQDAAAFLGDYILKYTNTRLRSLTLTHFRKRFLANPDLRPAALFFVYLTHKLRGFRQNLSEGLARSDFAGLLELDLLFGFCLVGDSVIKFANRSPNAQFIELAQVLLSKIGSNLGHKELGKINERFKADFGGAISEVLKGSVCGLTLQPLETDIALTYGLRNRGAHNIEGHAVIFDNFEDVVERVMNTLFISIEVLYCP